MKRVELFAMLPRLIKTALRTEIDMIKGPLNESNKHGYGYEEDQEGQDSQESGVQAPRMDQGRCPPAQDAGPTEDRRDQDRQDVEAHTRRDDRKGAYSRRLAQHALTACR